MTERRIINGEYSTSVRIPEETMKLLDKKVKLHLINFNKLVIEALEHYASCPIPSPKKQMQEYGAMVNEIRERQLHLELEFEKLKEKARA